MKIQWNAVKMKNEMKWNETSKIKWNETSKNEVNWNHGIKGKGNVRKWNKKKLSFYFLLENEIWRFYLISFWYISFKILI